MKDYRLTAVRVCGLATLFLVVVAVAELSVSYLGIAGLPKVQLATGMAVLVALVGFVLANVRSQAAAESISMGATATIAILSALYVYKAVATPVGPLLPAAPPMGIMDAVLSMALMLGLIVMCISVRREGRAAPSPSA